METGQLYTESDVEQKLLYPFLTQKAPFGLGLHSSQIRTKPDIRTLTIDKGKKEKLYYPDYVVLVSGVPVMIVEAKAPGDDLQEAFREARLYATELNSKFEKDLNPAFRVLCANDTAIWTGSWDSNTPAHILPVNQIDPSNKAFAELCDFLSNDELNRHASSILKKLVSRPYRRPINLLGGESVRNEEIGINSFGANIALSYKHIFNPTTLAERENIVKNSYIISKRRERYVQPIDKIIRAASTPSISDATLINDTSNPDEIVGKLRDSKNLQNHIILLVGGVGTGKSTFIDYLRAVALPEDVRESIAWINMNMNVIPLDRERAYTWICDHITEQLQQQLSTIDFEDITTVEKLYAPHLNKLRKGALKLLKPESEVYGELLAKEILRLQADHLVSARAMIRFSVAERRKSLIIVMDNCDKRIRDEQLFIFELAQWLQSEFRCLIIMPIRDVTYDNHRDEPPLDTALKDLVFRIEPPMFSKVLQARIKHILREMPESDQKKGSLTYTLSKGIQVRYPSSDQAMYLACILKSVFDYDGYIRRLLVGLAGRNLRKAMELFLDFCKSGHISEDLILKIRMEDGKYRLPYHVVTRVLLRQNRRFYDGNHSHVTNLFQCIPKSANPNNFVRVAILRWLDNNLGVEGPNRLPGYHPVSTLIAAIAPLGISEEIALGELIVLLRGGCVIAEHLRDDKISREDLVRLGPAGFVHLKLLSDPQYIAACAEDIWFDEPETANAIAMRIGHRTEHYSRITVLKNAQTLRDYLKRKRTRLDAHIESFMDYSERHLISMDEIDEAVSEALEKHETTDPWFTVDRDFPVGKRVMGVIKLIKNYGLFVRLKKHIDGLLHVSKLREAGYESDIWPGVDDDFEVEILSRNVHKRRIELGIPKDNWLD